MTTLLAARNVSAGYNGQPVIRGCSLQVATGQAVALVGRNGAGKTTLVSAISGRLPLMSGELEYQGRGIGHLPAFRRSRIGIIHVPQGREVFARLSVFENLRIAASRAATAAEWDFVYDLFPVLRERLEQRAGTLSGGEQQMVAIARAILARASLILLDEPSLGLAPKVVEALFSSIRRMRERLEITLVLVEQQARWIWEAGIVDHIYVLGDGIITASGSPDSLDEAVVQESYLGRASAT